MLLVYKYKHRHDGVEYLSNGESCIKDILKKHGKFFTGNEEADYKLIDELKGSETIYTELIESCGKENVMKKYNQLDNYRYKQKHGFSPPKIEEIVT